MNHPLDDFNDEEIVHYIQSLLEQVEARLELKQYSACAWRLADCLGAIVRISPAIAGGTPGIENYTGLGYRLQTESRDDNPQQDEETQPSS